MNSSATSEVTPGGIPVLSNINIPPNEYSTNDNNFRINKRDQQQLNNESSSNSSTNPNVSIFKQIIQRLDFIDKKYSRYIHKMELGIFDTLIAIPGTSFGVIGCPLIWGWYYYKYSSLFYPMCCLAVFCINHSIKLAIGRRRPLYSSIGKKLIPLKKMHNDPSMPSGDCAQAACAAITLVLNGHSLWFCVFIPATSAFARVYFGSHFIGDCIVGTGFAFALTLAMHTLRRKYFKK